MNGTPSGVETIEVTPSTGVTIFISGGTPVPVTEHRGFDLYEAPKIPIRIRNLKFVTIIVQALP